MRSRSQAAVQLARPLGRVLPEALAPRFGVVAPTRSIIEEMLEAEEAARTKRMTFDGRPSAPPVTKVSTPPPRPAPPSMAPAAGRPESDALPPQVPKGDALTRAVALLAACAKGQVGKTAREELPHLIGTLPPDAETAHRWKVAMMAIKRAAK